MVFRYVPQVRSKAGEAIALDNLAPPAKDRMFPVVNLTAAVPATFTPRLARAWAGRPLALDGSFNFDATGSATEMQGVANALRAAGVTVVPCIEYGAQPGYLATVQAISQSAPAGLVVKTRLGHVHLIAGWLAAAGWKLSDVDLIISAGHLADFGGPGVVDQLVLTALMNLQSPAAWRSVTLSASSAPKDMSALGLGPNLVPRLEWSLWDSMRAQVPFRLDFGDCGIGHPDLSDPPGFVMGNATVSVRYTLDAEWLILKGRPVSGRTGLPMPQQYLAHAQTLAAHPSFGGVPGCWGDQRIQQIAVPTGTSGSRQSWVEIGVNRHLSLVADRLP